MAFKAFKEKRKIAFFFSTVDHACVFNLKEDLEVLGHDVSFFGVDHDGFFNLASLTAEMLVKKSEGYELALNFTTINNESGIHWPLSSAVAIKQATGAFVHVDAVQMVGKIKNWKQLASGIDSYTFSGHKFGSLKGIGFTFIQKKTAIDPLIVGGTQQQGMRAGTENAMGIYSLKLALEEFNERFDPVELKSAKDFIEISMIDFLGARGEIVGLKNANRNLNTVLLMLKSQKAELLSARFDLMGVDLSTGSACSTGVIKENRILMSMGYGMEDSRSAIRFSFSPFMNLLEATLYWDRVKQILGDILK
jgi:cysteine desulfurase